jgi:hypothetical protein
MAAFASSYIPTAASQVTRNADAASMTGVNFSSWFRADAGTLYSEHQSITGTNQRAFVLGDGTTNNVITLLVTNSSGNGTSLGVTTAGVLQVTAPSNIVTAANTVYRLAGAYQTNNANGARNGTLGSDDTSVLLPVADRAFIGAGTATSQFLNGHIRKLAYYPARLTNAQLQALTS